MSQPSERVVDRYFAAVCEELADRGLPVTRSSAADGIQRRYYLMGSTVSLVWTPVDGWSCGRHPSQAGGNEVTDRRFMAGPGGPPTALVPAPQDTANFVADVVKGRRVGHQAGLGFVDAGDDYLIVAAETLLQMMSDPRWTNCRQWD